MGKPAGVGIWATFAATLSLFCAVGALAAQPADEPWPQLQRDARHTGYSPEVLVAPNGFVVGWQVDFGLFDPPEHIFRTVQVIAAYGRLYVPTQEGNLYALDAQTGNILWKFASGEGVMHTAAADDGKVFIATIGASVFAVDAQTGKQAWRWKSDRRTGFSSAVCVAEGKVFVTGRGGDVHALSQSDGRHLWERQIPAPIYQTAAYNDGRIYFAAEDMHAYALSSEDGRVLWRSRRLSGMSFRDFHPLVHEGVVIVESQPAWNNQGAQYFFDGWKFPLSGWWTFTDQKQIDWVNQYGPLVEKGTIPPEAMADITAVQDDQVSFLKSRPQEMLRFAFDENTGQEPFVLPLFIQAMCGPQPPPAVGRDGKLIIPVVFGRCGWGLLDLKTQRIADIFFNMGRIDGKAYQVGHGGCSGDENISHSAAGPWVFVIHVSEFSIGPGPVSGHPAGYSGAYNLDERRWRPLPSGLRMRDGRRNNQGHNAQCGNNAISIAYGALYHQAFSVVHNWVPAGR